MSKIAASILIVLISLFSLPPSQVFADTPTCSSLGITYAPDAFSQNPSDITLSFTVNNPNTAKNLGSVRLHFIAPVSFGLGDINTNPATVSVSDTGGNFSINVLNIDKDSEGAGGVFRNNRIDALRSPGEHNGVLDSNTTGSFQELCKGIRYSVTSPFACVIDPNFPATVPLRLPFTVAFSGKPSTEYQLFLKPTNSGPLPFNPTRLVDPKWSVGKTTTNANGQGFFSNVNLVNVNSGDSADISIAATDASNEGGGIKNYNICTKPIKIDINAPTPNPNPSSVPTPGPGAGAVPSGKPITTSTGAKVCVPGDLTCTTGGGTPCDGIKGISTAIGCIHTNPIELVKDLFKFLVALGGGVAFLMMLLGAFQMVTSAGNPETLQAGRDRFTSAIIGLLMVIFAVLLLQIIGVGILAIPGFSAK